MLQYKNVFWFKIILLLRFLLFFFLLLNVGAIVLDVKALCNSQEIKREGETTEKRLEALKIVNPKWHACGQKLDFYGENEIE